MGCHTGVTKANNKRSVAWQRFKRHRRGYISLVLFLSFFGVSLMAEFVSNDSPLIVRFDGNYYFPVVVSYPETVFGGGFETETDYLGPFIRRTLSAGDNFIIFPLNPYSYNTINQYAHGPVPSSPSRQNYLGTDDRGRDVFGQNYLWFSFKCCLWA